MSPIETIFQSARARIDGPLSASIPIQNRIDGTQTIVFARRLESSSGNFARVIFASVNFRYFEAIYKSTQSLHNLIFTLVREDGTILFRYPDASNFVGEKLAAESAFHDTLSKGAEGYPHSGAIGWKRPICVGSARSGLSTLRQYLGDRSHRFGGLGSTVDYYRARQRRIAAVLDLPSHRDHEAGAPPERFQNIADAEVPAARRRFEQRNHKV